MTIYLNDGKSLCPFCISSFECEGPHIEEKDIKNYFEKLFYIREDFALLTKEIIAEYELENNIDLADLKIKIFNKIMDRIPI